MRRAVTLSLIAACALAGNAATGESGIGGPGGDRSATAAASGAGVKWRPGVGRATRYARDRAGDVRFAMIGLHGGMSRFHAGRNAPMASVFKVMLLVAYLHQPSVRDRNLRESDTDLLGPMIRRSDNVAATRVRDIVGRRRIERLANRAHMRSFRYHDTWGLSRTDARDQAPFMYRLERYLPGRHEHYARHLLSSIVSSQRWGVADVRPDGWKLRFKGGWGSGSGAVNHQVAFLDRKGWRVALAILTEGSPTHDYGKETLKGVAKRLLRGLPRLPKRD
jgi:hypothetical protein